MHYSPPPLRTEIETFYWNTYANSKTSISQIKQVLTKHILLYNLKNFFKTKTKLPFHSLWFYKNKVWDPYSLQVLFDRKNINESYYDNSALDTELDKIFKAGIDYSTILKEFQLAEATTQFWTQLRQLINEYDIVMRGNITLANRQYLINGLDSPSLEPNGYWLFRNWLVATGAEILLKQLFEVKVSGDKMQLIKTQLDQLYQVNKFWLDLQDTFTNFPQIPKTLSLPPANKFYSFAQLLKLKDRSIDGYALPRLAKTELTTLINDGKTTEMIEETLLQLFWTELRRLLQQFPFFANQSSITVANQEYALTELFKQAKIAQFNDLSLPAQAKIKIIIRTLNIKQLELELLALVDVFWTELKIIFNSLPFLPLQQLQRKYSLVNLFQQRTSDLPFAQLNTESKTELIALLIDQITLNSIETGLKALINTALINYWTNLRVMLSQLLFFNTNSLQINDKNYRLLNLYFVRTTSQFDDLSPINQQQIITLIQDRVPIQEIKYQSEQFLINQINAFKNALDFISLPSQTLTIKNKVYTFSNLFTNKNRLSLRFLQNNALAKAELFSLLENRVSAQTVHVEQLKIYWPKLTTVLNQFTSKLPPLTESGIVLDLLLNNQQTVDDLTVAQQKQLDALVKIFTPEMLEIMLYETIWQQWKPFVTNFRNLFKKAFTFTIKQRNYTLNSLLRIENSSITKYNLTTVRKELLRGLFNNDISPKMAENAFYQQHWKQLKDQWQEFKTLWTTITINKQEYRLEDLFGQLKTATFSDLTKDAKQQLKQLINAFVTDQVKIEIIGILDDFWKTIKPVLSEFKSLPVEKVVFAKQTYPLTALFANRSQEKWEQFSPPAKMTLERLWKDKITPNQIKQALQQANKPKLTKSSSSNTTVALAITGGVLAATTLGGLTYWFIKIRK